jgi:hypothetical protein
VGVSVIDDLKEQIRNGAIVFDPPAPTSERLRRELFGTNAGAVKVTADLQRLVLRVSRIAPIRVSSILRDGATSHHAAGRAFDVGNEAIAGVLLPEVANDETVAEWRIDEIIFDAAAIAGVADRQKWNYDQGVRHAYDAATIAQHGNHIHFAVLAPVKKGRPRRRTGNN